MKGKKLLSAIIAGTMVLGTMSFPAFAEDSVGVEYNGTTYASFAEARDAVASDATEITYTIHGKVILPSGYIKDITGTATSAETVNFKAADGDVTAELALEGTGANIIGLDLIGAVKNVNYEDLILSRTNGSWIGDIGHANNYFTTAMRGVADSIVNYTNCTFPNGSCNNYYNKTTYTDCKFHNDSEYGLWIYGGETEVTGATFTGAKGVQAYSEDVNADVTTKITNSTFDGITKKPAIISGTKGTVTLENITTTNCVYGLLQTKPKDGRSDLPYAEVTVDGKEPAYVAMVGSSIYTNQAFAEKEAEEKGTTALPVAAKVNGQFYSTLADAIASLADASGDVVINVLDDTQLQLAGFYVHLVNDNITSLTINGNGHSINVIADYRLRLWMTGKLIINNATLTSDWYEAYTWDSWDFLFDCETELTDVTLNREIALEQDAKLTNVTINNSSADDSYAIWIPTNGQNIALDNVTINASGSGKRGIKIDNQYVDDAAVGKVELKVENSTFNTNKKAAILVKSPVGAMELSIYV